MKVYDVIIVGGGLAGLTAAVHLAKAAHQVLLVEKQRYPHHKVCGEYVSNEIVPYLEFLDISLSSAVKIDTLQLTTESGASVTTSLPLGGLGISRYAFDETLYLKALSLEVTFVFETVASIDFVGDIFHVKTAADNSFKAKLVIGAYGKRSALDKQLQRSFIQEKSSWLGVKAHYQYDEFPDNKVALHNFNGGYAGLSKTESGAVNFCYLVSYESFKKEKSIASFNKSIVAKNPFLNHFLGNAKPLFGEPLSIAQVSFYPKAAVENHVLMCGDTAGLIHPLCGNGMAMAIHSAKIASELIDAYLNAENPDRGALERKYQVAWATTFKQRIRAGRLLQSVLLNHQASKLAMKTVAKSPWLLRTLIKKTHGDPITC